MTGPAEPTDAELFERRFGGLRRLYGVEGAQRIFDAHVVIVGLGGVGSWSAEALARSGVRRLTLIDMDHVAESNINRQIHAQLGTLGQAKIEALRERIHSYHPGCGVQCIDDFVSADNWPALLGGEMPDAVIDACDQVKAKTAIAAWSWTTGVPLAAAGAAGGKRHAERIEIGDLASVTHDPLLAQLRYRLRKFHGGARQGAMQLACVFSREAVAPPDPSCGLDAGDGSLNCHGFGSVVSVTASAGMAAAGWVMNTLAAGNLRKVKPPSKTPKNDAII